MRYQWLLSFLMLYSLIIYPSWYTPDDLLWTKLLLFHIFYGVILLIIFISSKRDIADKFVLPHRIPRGFLLITAGYLLGVLPFINFPVISHLDSHLHTGFAANMTNTVNTLLGKLIPLTTYVPFYWIFAIGAALLFFVVRRRIPRWLTPMKMVVILYPFLLAYALIVVFKLGFHQLGDPALLHRYLPLGKSLFALMYGLFGYQPFAGRLTQIGFNLLTVYLLYTFRWDKKDNGQAGRFAAITFIFLPPVWNILYLNHLEMGTMFFVTATLLAFLHYNREQSDRNLLRFWLVFIAGLMYKRFLVLIFPTIVIFYLFSRGSLKERVHRAYTALAVPFIFFFPFYCFDKIYSIAPLEARVAVLNSLPVIFFAQLLLLVPFCGSVISLIFLGGLGNSVRQWRSASIRLFLLFSLVFLILQPFFGIWSLIRHLLALVPVLALLGGQLLSRIEQRQRWIAIVLIVVFLAEAGYINYFDPESNLINFATAREYGVPFESMAAYIAAAQLTDKTIYAPNICEASHFYFLKQGVAMDNYHRKVWAPQEEQTVANLFSYLTENDYDYFVLPVPRAWRRTRYDHLFLELVGGLAPEDSGYRGGCQQWDLLINPAIHQQIYQNYSAYGWREVASFTHGNNTTLLLACPPANR